MRGKKRGGKTKRRGLKRELDEETKVFVMDTSILLMETQ